EVGCLLAFLRLAYEYGHDVRIVRHDWQAGGVEHGFDACGAFLMAFALEARGLQVPNRGRCCGADRGWKRGGEDKARRVAAYRIAEHRTRGDIASEAAKPLREPAL